MKFLKIVVLQNTDNAVQFDLKMQVSHPELSDYNNGKVIDALLIYKLGDCVTVDDVHKDRSVNRLFQTSDKRVNIKKIDSFAFIGTDKDGNEAEYKYAQVTLPYRENGFEIPLGIYQNYEQPIYNITKNPVSDNVVITSYDTIDTLSEIIDSYLDCNPKKSNKTNSVELLQSIINSAKEDRKHFLNTSFGHQTIK
tara:strand:+ start:157 stop:741 length:585 start_codon:yes stop_codon:yes gene_type:complete